MSITTQGAQILKHLERGRTINPKQADHLFGCTRLAARIHELKKGGHSIEKQMIEVETRDGKARVAQYWLAA